MNKNKDLVIVEKKKNIQEYFSTPVCMKHLRESLPKIGITADRMVRLLFSAIAQTPQLAECSPKSLFNVMIQCATVGLEPNTALGHAYIIPFGNNATLIYGYKGLIELCRRSESFASVIACEVYPSDKFEIMMGTESYIKHIPNYEQEYTEQDILGCYAVAKMKDGSYMFEYMPKHKIELIKKRSKAAEFGPWKTDYVMMARKTVIRRLMHYLPLTIEMAKAIEADGKYEAGVNGMDDVISDAFLPDQTKGQQLTEEIKAAPKAETKAKTQPKKTKQLDKPKDIKKDPPPDKEKAPAEKAADTATLMRIVKSFNIRDISELELCAYFGVDDLTEMDTPEGLADLQKIASDIEGGKMPPDEFKKQAAERFKMKQKGAQ